MPLAAFTGTSFECVHTRLPSDPEGLFAHSCTERSVVTVCEANSGNLCLHLYLQANVLIVFNQQWRGFISMFCAVYSLSDNVVIIKFFPTSKLGDCPSFFLNSHLIPKYDETLSSSFRLVLCFQEA